MTKHFQECIKCPKSVPVAVQNISSSSRSSHAPNNEHIAELLPATLAPAVTPNVASASSSSSSQLQTIHTAPIQTQALTVPRPNTT